MSWGDWGLTDTPEVRWRLAIGIDKKDNARYPLPETAQRLKQELDEWHNNPNDPNPERNWWTIEDFLKDVYPGAHRGMYYGNEQARPLLDGVPQPQTGWGLDGKAAPPPPKEPYETGPEAFSKYGYDPKEIAATALLLHNRGGGGREVRGQDVYQLDIDRLSDIARKRSQMQRDYESRTARRLFLAMAWEDYKDKIQGGCKDGCGYGPEEPTWIEESQRFESRPATEGRYVIPQAGAFLNYSHGSYMGKPEIKVETIYTHPSNRNDGVAEALMRRLAEDHPDVPINPGLMTRDGQGFHDKMLEKEPSARDLVTAAMQVLAMAKRIGPGYYEHQTDHGKFQITQVNNPAYRGSSWYLHYPSEHDPHNEASEYPDDVFRTKRDALAVANEWKGRE